MAASVAANAALPTLAAHHRATTAQKKMKVTAGSSRVCSFACGGAAKNVVVARAPAGASSGRSSHRRRFNRVFAVASPSLPETPELPIPDFLKGPLEGIVKQVLRIIHYKFTFATSIICPFF